MHATGRRACARPPVVPGGISSRAVCCCMCGGCARRLCGADAVRSDGSGFCCSCRAPCTAVLRRWCSVLLRQAVLQADSPLHVGVIRLVVELRLCAAHCQEVGALRPSGSIDEGVTTNAAIPLRSGKHTPVATLRHRSFTCTNHTEAAHQQGCAARTGPGPTARQRCPRRPPGRGAAPAAGRTPAGTAAGA